MARIIQNKYPVDTSARTAVGFGFPFNGPAVFVPTYETRDQIRANLINYLLTNRGERVFNPNFGANLRKLLFENIDGNTLEDLRYIIQEEIGKRFPQISVKKIQFKNEIDNNTINFILTYEVILFGIEETVNILIT